MGLKIFTFEIFLNFALDLSQVTPFLATGLWLQHRKWGNKFEDKGKANNCLNLRKKDSKKLSFP